MWGLRYNNAVVCGVVSSTPRMDVVHFVMDQRQVAHKVHHVNRDRQARHTRARKRPKDEKVDIFEFRPYDDPNTDNTAAFDNMILCGFVSQGVDTHDADFCVTWETNPVNLPVEVVAYARRDRVIYTPRAGVWHTCIRLMKEEDAAAEYACRTAEQYHICHQYAGARPFLVLRRVEYNAIGYSVTYRGAMRQKVRVIKNKDSRLITVVL